MALPLAIKTLTVDGKKLSPAFFRQIEEEDVINEETGELEGVALGFVNVHQKGLCPDCWHRHILWSKGQALRQGIIVEPEDAEVYQTLQAKSQHVQYHLQDVLALRLAHTQHAVLTHAGDRSTVTMGERSLTLSTDTFTKLHELEQARAYQEQARSRWLASAPVPNHHADSVMTQPQARLLEQARNVQRHLASDILLAHPELTQHTPEGDLMVLGMYGKEPDHQRREYKFGWLLYESGEDAPEQRHRVLWRSKSRSTDDITAAYASEIEAQLAPVVSMLPYLLAEQAVERILDQIDQRASALAKQVKLQPARSKRSTLPDLALIEQLLWNEQERFQRYTARWQQSLTSLEGIEQLFIVS